MKKHEIKIKISEDTMNAILDSKMNEKEIELALECFADQNLETFLKYCGFSKYANDNVVECLINCIKKKVYTFKDKDSKKATNLLLDSSFIEVEELINFIISMSPDRNRRTLERHFGSDSPFQNLIQ